MYGYIVSSECENFFETPLNHVDIFSPSQNITEVIEIMYRFYNNVWFCYFLYLT